MKLIVKFIFGAISTLKKIDNKVKKYFIKKYLLAKCGENVNLGKNIVATYSNLEIGDNSSIGENAYILNTVAKVIIKNNVMIAPNVTFVTGNHRTDIVGKYMSDIKEEEKLLENDEKIIIEEDVWIGTNVTILKGVTVKRGCIIGAGSIISKSTEEYNIYTGSSAMKIKTRFPERNLKKHIKIMEKINEKKSRSINIDFK